MSCLYLTDSDPSVVVVPGTKVNVSCWCPGSSTSMVIDGNYIYSESQTPTQNILDERGIAVIHYSLDSSSGFIISTNATAESNGTFFHCYNSQDKDSPTVYIYVVYGKTTCVNYIISLCNQ